MTHTTTMSLEHAYLLHTLPESSDPTTLRALHRMHCLRPTRDKAGHLAAAAVVRKTIMNKTQDVS